MGEREEAEVLPSQTVPIGSTEDKPARKARAKKAVGPKTGGKKKTAAKKTTKKTASKKKAGTVKAALENEDAKPARALRGAALRSHRRALFAAVDAQVCDVLVELMCASESDAVRVSAAKALMDQARRNEEADDGDGQQPDKNERAQAIAEIRRIMGELADAKSGGGAGPRAVDQDGACSPIDPEG